MRKFRFREEINYVINNTRIKNLEYLIDYLEHKYINEIGKMEIIDIGKNPNSKESYHLTMSWPVYSRQSKEKVGSIELKIPNCLLNNEELVYNLSLLSENTKG